MASMTDDEIDRLLRAPEVGVLATADTEGKPEGTPIWFEWDGARIQLLVHRASRKARNIRLNPHVSLTVDTRKAPYKGVVLRGIAALSGPDPALRRRLAVRYLGEDVARSYLGRTAMLDAEDALVMITVTGHYSWDYSKGF